MDDIAKNISWNLSNYISDPKNPEYNFRVGIAYDERHHTSTAIGFYLRTAELTRDKLLQYESILKMANCFSKQGNRRFVIYGLLLRAISIMPNRPEAYFLLSKEYENGKSWEEAYTWSKLGANNFTAGMKSLKTDVGYPGAWGFDFEMAVAAWWMGMHAESLYLFRKLKNNPNVKDFYRGATLDNLARLNNQWKDPDTYDHTRHERLKNKFYGSDKIERNYSQCFQDMFVLAMLDGKTDGKFVEIGHGHPKFTNNTALLEKLGWEGISIDNDEKLHDEFEMERSSTAILGDATKLDYGKLLHGKMFDYLQVDIDPAEKSLEALIKVTKDNSFKIITFEHDHYSEDTGQVRERSRDYLYSLGYKLVVPDVGMSDFEDWWIHPDYIFTSKTYAFKDVHRNGTVNNVADFMFN